MSLYTVSLNPLEIPSLYLWVDAADISTINTGSLSANDGDPIIKVTDKKNGIQFTNTSGSQPTYKHKFINDKNVLAFTHLSTTNLSIQSSMITTPRLSIKTIFFVFKPIGSPLYVKGNQYPLSIYTMTNLLNFSSSSLANNYPDFSITYSDPRKETRYLETQNHIDLTVNRFKLINPNILQIVGVRTSTDINKFDFESELSELSNQYGNEPKLNLDRWFVTLGDIVPYAYIPDTENVPYAIPFEGYICELLLFTDDLSDYDYNRVNEYLQSKWFES